MKLSDLRLDTVYAGHDGNPLMVLSLAKYVVPRSYFGRRSQPFRLAAPGERGTGVVVIRHTFASRQVNIPELQGLAKNLGGVPEAEQVLGDYNVVPVLPRNIVGTWEDYVAQQEVAAAKRRADAEKYASDREVRSAQIARIHELLPEGMKVSDMADYRDYASVPLGDLIQLLEAAAKTR